MKTLIVTEKLNVAAKIGALGKKVLGSFVLSNGIELTPDYLSKNEQKINGIISKMGRLENDKYIIQYAAGHLVELFQASDYNPEYKNWSNIPLGYVPKPFRMKAKQNTENLFKSLKATMNSNEVKDIIIATDADREGANIFALLYRLSGCSKPCRRLWADTFTEGGIEKAFNKIKDNKEYIGLENAGYGRMTSDFLMGALLTAKATTSLGWGKDIINVGRVQTAVLAEIVRVENLVKNFKKQKSYQLVGKFKNSNGDIYEGVYEEKFDELAKAQKLISQLQGNTAKVVDASKEKEKKWCPPLFDQTGLAIELASKYGMSPDETLKASQGLYEKGFQTYPRTASRYISSDDAKDFGKMLSKIATINPLATKHPFSASNKRIVDSSKVESHSAIVPTEYVPDLSKLSDIENKAYTEVMLRAIAINFPPSVDEKQVIDTEIKGIKFHSTGKKELERGFREVYNTKKEDKSLPEVKKGEIVEVLSIGYKEVETQPPKRYTQGTILNFMESCGKKIEDEDARELMKNKGIGTSATRAEIINKLISTKYIEVKGKTIYPTEKGIKMIEVLPCEELKNAEFTGNLEFKLYQVETNQLPINEYMEFIEKVYIDSCNKLNKTTTKVSNMNNSNEKSLGKCPSCGNAIVHKKGKGPKGNYDFYSCSNWKGGCKFTIGEICYKKLTEAQVKTLLEKGETNPIKGFKKKDGSELSPAKVILKNNKTELKWD